MIEQVKLKGKYKLELIRNGKVIHSEEVQNSIVDAGMNSMLGVSFHADTQITAWYCGLVDNASFSAFANGDTMSSHAGWIECTAYTESVRQTWGAGAAAARSITNASQMVFSINATKTLQGIFIASLSTKSGTTGTLLSTGAFSSTINVQNGDSLKITYTVSG